MESRPPQHIDFVRPPPAPPPTAQERKFAPLITFGEGLVAVGLLVMFGGCGVSCLGAGAGWGPIGLSGAGGGVAFVVLGLVVRLIGRRAQTAG